MSDRLPSGQAVDEELCVGLGGHAWAIRPAPEDNVHEFGRGRSVFGRCRPKVAVLTDGMQGESAALDLGPRRPDPDRSDLAGNLRLAVWALKSIPGSSRSYRENAPYTTVRPVENSGQPTPYLDNRDAAPCQSSLVRWGQDWPGEPGGCGSGHGHLHQKRVSGYVGR